MVAWCGAGMGVSGRNFLPVDVQHVDQSLRMGDSVQAQGAVVHSLDVQIGIFKWNALRFESV